jgi:hypothetical protein
MFNENFEVRSPSASFANLTEGLSVCAATSKNFCTDMHAALAQYFHVAPTANTRIGTDQIPARAPFEAL